MEKQETNSGCPIQYVGELTWLQHLLQEINILVPTHIPPFCDNQATMHIASTPVFHKRTKHTEADCHFIRIRY